MEGAPGSRGRRRGRKDAELQRLAKFSRERQTDRQTKSPKEPEDQRERQKRETERPKLRQARETGREKKQTGWHDHAGQLGHRETHGEEQGQGRHWGAAGRGRGGLTLSSSSGRSPPSLMPRFMATKRSRPGLSRTLGL